MRNPIDIIVGRNVRRLRIVAGISQTDLAVACGLSFQQIQKYENGNNRISASKLVEMHRALGCEILDLFDGVDAKAKQIQTHGSKAVRLNREMLGNYNVLPTGVQKAMCNLMEATTIALGVSLNPLGGKNG